MGHTGRIVVTSINVLLFAIIKVVGYFYYDIPPLRVPFLAIPYILIFWWLGGHYDKAKFLSEKDVLTKLYNRRYIINIFPKLQATAKRKQGRLAVFYLDVDKFKTVNDTYGHVTGDRVLELVSRVLLDRTSNGAFAARWSGDEFLILSPLLHETEAEQKAERIKHELTKASHDLPFHLSVSIGVAVYPGDGETLDALLKAADERMYKLKFASKSTREAGT